LIVDLRESTTTAKNPIAMTILAMAVVTIIAITVKTRIIPKL